MIRIGMASIWAALVLPMVTFVILAMPVQAQMPGASLNVPATIMAETQRPAPGQSVTIAFKMQPKPTWHGYWENPGDAGIGMQLKWNLPKGVTAEKLRYPVPGTLMISGLMNYVYETPYTLLVDLKVDASVPEGKALPITVRGDWLACTDQICVPEGDDLAIELVAGNGAIKPAVRSEFDRYRAALPAPLDRTGQYAISGKFIEIAVPFPANAQVQAPYFFALTPDVVDYPVTQTARRLGDMLIIRAGFRDLKSADNESAGIGGAAIAGVLRYGNGQGLIISAIPGAVPAGGAALPMVSDNAGAAGAGSGGDLSFIWILAFSILGGLILNLMPCVFPILGLKAVAIAKMGGDAGAAKRDALAYSAGVILSVMALGGVMLMLRSAGEQVGWAFQLQEPRVVIILLLLMVAVTANLLGTFEFGSIGGGGPLMQKPGISGSFWTGVLAAVVATPCTGPFMAAAMGAALVLSPLPALMIFAGLGLGLSLPYLAIAYVAPFRAMLPKPGPWLGKFRIIMAVPMALTAAALLWLLWRLSGFYGLVLGAAASAALIVVLGVLGNRQRRGLSVMMWAALAAPVVFAAVITLPRNPVVMSTANTGLVQVETFTQTRLAQYRSAGTPVFVYFTADWCVTCKVNEAVAIQKAATAKAFSASGIKVLEGDFTRRDPELSRVLTQYGRTGVPLYLYFPKNSEPRILPQILSPQMLTELK